MSSRMGQPSRSRSSSDICTRCDRLASIPPECADQEAAQHGAALAGNASAPHAQAQTFRSFWRCRRCDHRRADHRESLKTPPARRTTARRTRPRPRTPTMRQRQIRRAQSTSAAADISPWGQGNLTAPSARGRHCPVLEAHGITVGASPGYGRALTMRKNLTAVMPARRQAKYSFTLRWCRHATRFRRAKRDGDSVGGVIECGATGLLAVRRGCLTVWKLPGRFGIPAVRGVELAACRRRRLRGSEHNDPFYFADGKVRTRRNNSGGIQGGITNGMPLLLRTAFKPTPSIAKEQDTVDLATGENVKLSIVGRHDPCVVVRAVPVVEAVTALVLLDVLREDGRL